MSVVIYDDALKEKIKTVFGNVVLSPPDKAFKRCAELEMNNGDVRLPLISLYRQNYGLNREFFNKRGMRRGMKTQYTSQDKSSVQMLRGIPVRIDYQMDIWHNSDREISKLVAELLFWLLDNPKVEASIPNTLKASSAIINEGISNGEIEIGLEEKGKEGNNYTVEVIDNTGTASVTMSASITDYTLSVNLGTDSSGNLDSTQNTASNISGEINNIDGFTSEYSGDGSGVLSSTETDNFSGGSDELKRNFDFIIDDMTDNSDIMSFEERGRIYRVTINFYFENAVLFAIDELKTVLESDIMFEVYDD